MPHSSTRLTRLEEFDKTAMIMQLHEFCEINSGSYHLSGLASMQQTLQSAFSPLADHIDVRSFPPISTIDLNGNSVTSPAANALLIQKRPELTRRVLLCGHMDTVYDSTHPFQTLTYLDNNRINGPGVADMKGGLIVMLHALHAFEQHKDASSLGWDVLINADEEIGSLASQHLIRELAPHYQAALVYEPAMTPQGLFAKNRKGSGKLTLVVTGRAAHAGRAFEEGRNAICYLAELIVQIHALNGQREGVTINVGLIAGGSALNVVPDKAVTKLDIRISQTEDEAWVRQALHHMMKKMQHPDYHVTLHGSFERPVKTVTPATNALFQRIQSLGKHLGLTLNWQNSGGCCDGNNLSQHGIPVIDTLGVRGGNIHSADEYILLDSLTERALLSALLLSDLAQGGLETLS